MKLSLLLAVIACMVMLSTAKWSTFCTDYDGNCPNVLIDIAVINNTEYCVVGGYSTTQDESRALGVWCADAANPEGLTRLQHHNVTGMQVSIAAGMKNSLVTCGIGFLNYTSGLLYSHDLDNVWNSQFYGAFGQDVKAVQSNDQTSPEKSLFGFVGQLSLESNDEGLLLSSSGGKSWFAGNSPKYGHFFRYGAYPTLDDWYISAGTWPESAQLSADIDSTNRCIRLSRHVCQPAPSTMDLKEIVAINKRIYDFTAKKRDMLKEEINGGYYGAIWKTSDQGRNWDLVFDSYDFYFNDIACYDAQNCVAVAEASKHAMIWTTKNGGKTWEQTLSFESSLLASLFRIRAVSSTEIYASGGMFDDKTGTLQGLIYKSTDGGVTWDLQASVEDVGILVGLSFSQDGSVGFAIGSTQDSRSIVARYQRD